MDKLTIYTRGAAQGNPGPAAVGVHVKDVQGNTVLEVSESIGNATAEYAEYYSVVRGLQAVKEQFGEEAMKMTCELRQESELVHNQLNAKATINDVSLIGHFIEIYNVRVQYFPNLVLTKISRAQNKRADQLVNEALDA